VVAIAGQRGVGEVVRNVPAEPDMTTALQGRSDVGAITCEGVDPS
jgi:hypothetical protein